MQRLYIFLSSYMVTSCSLDVKKQPHGDGGISKLEALSGQNPISDIKSTPHRKSVANISYLASHILGSNIPQRR